VPLAPYRKKRDFQKTPEPRGTSPSRAPKRGTRLRFVVQKHAASRLHYDFRLELEGVLKSWAIPKGPSLDPSEKRLAVMVEDHPLEYGGFEGTIPKGQYGGGTVLLWDRGSWEPVGDPSAGLRKGHLAFTLKGAKLRGSFHLVRLKDNEGKNWLLMKQKDEWARRGSIVEDRPESVATGRAMEEIAGARRGRVWQSNREPSRERAPARPVAKRRAPRATIDPATLPGARPEAIPRDPRPQLATLVPEAPEGDDWIHEIKYDGFRVLARIERAEVRMITRSGLDWTERFSAVAEALRDLPAQQAILDGEVAVVLEDGSTSFQALQNQMRAGDDALVYFVFDLIHWDGYGLTQVPLERRKEALASLLDAADAGPVVRYSDHVEGRGGRFRDEACRRGLEGIVSKRRGSVYVSGRTGSWLKTKCASRQEFVIGGYTEPQGSREGLGSLLLGTHENGDGLRYRGRVGTGFTRDTLERLLRKLRPLEVSRPPFSEKLPASRGVHWVRPELVAEVSFGSWTNDGRLRHPSFEGLREDKPAREVVRERASSSMSSKAGGTRSTKRRAPPERRRPPDTPTRRPPPVREPVHKPPVADPPTRPRKRPVKEPLDSVNAMAGVTISSPGKILYPEVGVTKIDVARYYHVVAGPLLTHAAGRPLMLLRCPEGRASPCFFQKHPSGPVPPSFDTIRIRERKGTADYLLLRHESGLLDLAQRGVLEIHIWGARGDSLERPDRVVFDFDPDPGSPWKDVVFGARRMRERLERLDLESFVKTTGGQGLHVVVPIRRGPTWDDVAEFSGALAAELTRDEPERFTTHLAKARRNGRVFIDTLRNRRGATWVAPYSPRAREGASVSMPVRWDELSPSQRPDRFTIPKILRTRTTTDAWSDIDGTKQTLSRGHLRVLRRSR